MNIKLNFDAERNQFVGQMVAKVVSLGDKLLANSNGTEYAVGTIEYKDDKGHLVQRSAICFQANLEKGITIGNEYLCNVTFTADRPNEPIISISPLTSAVRATAEDFGFDFAKAMSEVGVGAEQTV